MTNLSPEEESQRLRSALDAIDPNRLALDEWYKIGCALKRGGYDYSLFDAWSARDAQSNEHGKPRYNPESNRKQWDAIDTGKTGATVATIYQMAKESGWSWDYKDHSGTISGKPCNPSTTKPNPPERLETANPPCAGVQLNENAVAECTLDNVMGAPKEDGQGRTMAAAYLRAAFRDDEFVEICGAMYENGDPRRVQNYWHVCDLLEMIEKGNVAEIFGGVYDRAAGVWITANPFDPEKLKAENRADGQGKKAATDDSVTAFRHVLAESDSLELHGQEQIIRELNLPVTVLTYSGGKSLHALIRVDAKDRDEYRKRVKIVFEALEARGFKIDAQNKNPARLTRFAGFNRGNTCQRLLGTNIGAESWDAWYKSYTAATAAAQSANETATATTAETATASAETTANETKAQEDAAKARIRASFVENHIDGFMDNIAESFNTPRTSTGFKELDRQLGGGLYEGLYVLGAPSSLGKTTLVMQMAENIAKQKRNVLIFSLEMARCELMAKSLSRLTYVIAQQREMPKFAKSVRDITDGMRWRNYTQEDHDILDAAIEQYRAIIGERRLAIEEGVGDISAETIRQEVRAYKELCGKAPVIIVDYLQILAPLNERGTDKQNTDKAVMELKRISRDYKTPVIAISSFNRDAYGKETSMESFKESGGIEYSSDVLLGLQFRRKFDDDGKPKPININREKMNATRTVELDILKNRNGIGYGRVYFDYIPKYNFFQEAKREM